MKERLEKIINSQKNLIVTGDIASGKTTNIIMPIVEKMIANGVDLVTTANELGHANATTTASIYAHQIAIAKAKAANVRAGVFAGRSAKPKKKRA